MEDARIKEIESNIKTLREHNHALFFALQSIAIYLKMDDPSEALLAEAMNAIPLEEGEDTGQSDSVMEMYLPTILH